MSKFDLYTTFSLYADGLFVSCYGRGEAEREALFRAASRLAGAGAVVEVRPCL